MRLFCAIDSDPGLHPVIARAIDQCRPHGGDAKWTTPAQWHLTVKFFGEVGSLAVPELIDALTTVAASSNPVSLQLDGIGFFGGLNPKVIFAKVADTSGNLDRLASALNLAARPLGFHPDNQAFHPHVTLARVRSRADGKALQQAVRRESPALRGEWKPRDIVLYESILKPAGAEYKVLIRAPFGSAPPANRPPARGRAREDDSR